MRKASELISIGYDSSSLGTSLTHTFTIPFHISEVAVSYLCKGLYNMCTEIGINVTL